MSDPRSQISLLLSTTIDARGLPFTVGLVTTERARYHHVTVRCGGASVSMLWATGWARYTPETEALVDVTGDFYFADDNVELARFPNLGEALTYLRLYFGSL